jgi:hypothetical protein
VIELLWALLSRLLSDNNRPFSPWGVPVLAVLTAGDIDLQYMVTDGESASSVISL